jgi:hypothetical protein
MIWAEAPTRSIFYLYSYWSRSGGRLDGPERRIAATSALFSLISRIATGPASYRIDAGGGGGRDAA